jgi:ribosome biogenesis GTPase
MNDPGLVRWGWSDAIGGLWNDMAKGTAALLDGTVPLEGASLLDGAAPGRVIAEHRGAWDVATGSATVRAGLPGTPRRAAASRGSPPAVGDWVALRPAEGSAPASIVAILPRRSAFVRREPGRAEAEQVIAANVDTVFLVTAVGRDVNPRRLERYLAVAWASGAAPVIVVNKADLHDGLADAMHVAGRVAGRAPLIAVSALSGEGLASLETRMAPGMTVALLGSSGVGKSSIVNALLGEDLLDTRGVRADDDRGRHTTTTRMLVPLPGGACLLDTPGMREVGMAGGETEGALDAAFADVAALAAACRFTDCDHDTEPDCAVRLAVHDGTLPAERLASHRKLVHEARATAARLDARGRADERRETRRRGVAYREIFRAKYGGEADRW